MHPVQSTYKVLGDKLLETDTVDQWAYWALEMMENGFESEHLIILAGLNEPFNPFELNEITNKVLKELNIEYENEEKILNGFAYYLVNQALKNNLKYFEALRILKDVCVRLDYDKSLYPFYLLYCAKEDLVTQEIQFYWDGADRTNIDEVIYEYFTLIINNFENQKCA